MDFYWGEKMDCQRSFEGVDSNPRWLIFEILNLSAALFLCDEDKPIENDTWPQKEKHNLALRAAINLVAEVTSLSDQMLKKASTMRPNIVSLLLTLSIV